MNHQKLRSFLTAISLKHGQSASLVVADKGNLIKLKCMDLSVGKTIFGSYKLGITRIGNANIKLKLKFVIKKYCRHEFELVLEQMLVIDKLLQEVAKADFDKILISSANTSELVVLLFKGSSDYPIILAFLENVLKLGIIQTADGVQGALIYDNFIKTALHMESIGEPIACREKSERLIKIAIDLSCKYQGQYANVKNKLGMTAVQLSKDCAQFQFSPGSNVIVMQLPDKGRAEVKASAINPGEFQVTVYDSHRNKLLGIGESFIKQLTLVANGMKSVKNPEQLEVKVQPEQSAIESEVHFK